MCCPELSNRRFQFDKRSQLFIRTHNETLSVVAMCVCNPDRSPVRMNRCNTVSTPTGLAEIVNPPIFAVKGDTLAR
jgi:hypothetical protein